MPSCLEGTSVRSGLLAWAAWLAGLAVSFKMSPGRDPTYLLGREDVLWWGG